MHPLSFVHNKIVIVKVKVDTISPPRSFLLYSSCLKMAHSLLETFSLKVMLGFLLAAAATSACDILGRMVVWSVVRDDTGSQNNANLFSSGRFQLPFLPGVAFFVLRMVVLRSDLYYSCSYFASAAIFAVSLLMCCCFC